MALGMIGMGLASASADDAETPTIKTVMQKLHKGARSPLASLKTKLAGD